jgi:hypothetical protein
MKVKLLSAILISTMLLFASQQVRAATDTINFSNNRLITAQLKTGLKQYLVYFQNPAQKKMLNLSLWTREIKKISHKGESCFNTVQKWYGNDTTVYRTVNSINREKDFMPLYHAESIRGQLRAFNWFADHISGDATEPANSQKDFSLKFEQASFNWNLDIETSEMLPLAAGKQFVLYMYDAGSAAARYASYSVTGTEVLSTLDNQKVDCWILLTEGKQNGATFTQKFWISKKGHEFLMEEDLYNGMYRYKVKLPALAPDFISRFK